MRKKKVVFLDRDGTINVDSGFVCSRKNWKWTPGAMEAMKRLQEGGFLLAVVTNQSGIGHGLYTEQDMQKIHKYMRGELSRAGIELAGVFYCPHRRDAGCGCRKPATGMIEQAERQLGPIDYGQSWVIGDKMADVEMGKSKGMKTALIRSRYWQESDIDKQPDAVVDSLLEAAGRIVNSNPPSPRLRGTSQ